jgi:hypothetical protein
MRNDDDDNGSGDVGAETECDARCARWGRRDRWVALVPLFLVSLYTVVIIPSYMLTPPSSAAAKLIPIVGTIVWIGVMAAAIAAVWVPRDGRLEARRLRWVLSRLSPADRPRWRDIIACAVRARLEALCIDRERGDLPTHWMGTFAVDHTARPYALIIKRQTRVGGTVLHIEGIGVDRDEPFSFDGYAACDSAQGHYAMAWVQTSLVDKTSCCCLPIDLGIRFALECRVEGVLHERDASGRWVLQAALLGDPRPGDLARGRLTLRASTPLDVLPV